MKRIYTYLLMAASLTATSCSESWLDLNPSTSVTTDQALSTLTDIQTALYASTDKRRNTATTATTIGTTATAAAWMYRPAKAKATAAACLPTTNTTSLPRTI